MKKKTRLIIVSIAAILIITTLYLTHVIQQTRVAGDTTQQERTFTEKIANAFSKTFRQHIQSDAKPEDPWDIWVEEQTEGVIKAMLKERKKKYPGRQPLSAEDIEMRRNDFRTDIRAQLHKVKKEYGTPPTDVAITMTIKSVPFPKYEGPQTTEAILAEFADMYNATWETHEIAEKYPQDEWIQMLLDKGITIENSADFFWYQEPRRELIRIENDPSLWISGALGIPPIDDWETYKNAYIEKKLWRHELSLAQMKACPTSGFGVFVGENQEVFLPTTPNRVYVERFSNGASFYGASRNLTQIQKFELLTKGITPENYEIVYIDSKGNILSQPPPLLTREDILKAGGTPPPEEWFNEDFSPQAPFDFEMDITTQESTDYPKLDVPASVEKAQQNAQKQMEQRQQNAKKVLETLTKSDTDIVADLEKQLIPDLPTEADFEKVVRERFSPQRFNRALSTLNQYGPEEGLHRLKESDPELAGHIEKQLQR